MIDILPRLGAPSFYALSLAATWLAFIAARWLRERRTRARHRLATEAGSEPVSLHPVIDPARCVGCGACANACPEGRIIGLIAGKAHLVDPSSCIGHGACKTACPVGAIDLVFGTARRGVDIPVLSPSFESNVPGLFIAGELGGMGLIANAIEQGSRAIDAIRRLDGLGARDRYDVVIVGAGPAGLAASLAAKKHGLRALTLEQGRLGGTVAHFPRAKVITTRPADLPLVGKVRFRRVRKERLVALWHRAATTGAITVAEGVRCTRIAPGDGGFAVATTAGEAKTRAVLLATGRRGSPRRLGVPGEDLAKVVYSLDDPAQYDGRHVLVVGGSDSAIEAATTLARHRPASVTLAYRGARLTRCRPESRERLEAARRGGRIGVIMQSHVRAIEADQVILEEAGRQHAYRNDAVIVCIGGEMPVALLADLGVRVETKYGTA